ncbi:sugar ABC transporter substrate-binding protein [Pseudomonas cichorii]|uniref:ABC transporter substrate-binding protein n=1 Tax=Pseudomonas cichorii TaxID=36746 RepID=UPI001910096B|nr:ABC transporter substrate-binding protein [Pseudomonas cichorii]GFM88437.1 sugar ABC transporter substrate-binding protein [Pseudomonas cichorii]
MSGFIFRCLIILCGSWSGVALAASVTFLSPGFATDGYWQSYARVMQSAADETGMSLKVLYTDRDTRKLLDMAREALQGAGQRPDYLVFSNELNVAPEVLRLSQGSGVKLLAVNNTLTEDQVRILGDLPSRYPNFIGSLIGNDEEGGYLTARRLISLYPGLADGQPIEMLAFSGTNSTPVSLAREQGMRRALEEFPQVHLRQIVLGGWRRDRAQEQARVLLKRYPNIRLIWAANEQMALGAMDALRERGGEPGKDILFSAINGTTISLQAQLNGRLSVVATGHFTIGGWAMLLLHDYDAADAQTRPRIGERSVRVLELVERHDARRFLEAAKVERYYLDKQAFRREPVDGNSPFALKNMLPLVQQDPK